MHDPKNDIADSLTEILTALHGCMKFYGDDSSAGWKGVDGRFTLTVPRGEFSLMLLAAAAEMGVPVKELPDPAQLRMNTVTPNAIAKGKVR